MPPLRYPIRGTGVGGCALTASGATTMLRAKASIRTSPTVWSRMVISFFRILVHLIGTGTLPFSGEAERHASGAGNSGSEGRADAISRRLQALYRYRVLLSVILCTPGR